MGGIISGAAGAGFSAINAANQAQTIRHQGVLNDQLLGYQAGVTNQAGAAAGAKSRATSGGVVAAQHAAYANAGVDASSGTAAATQIATRGAGELDAQTIQNNAARAVWGLGVQRSENRINTDTGVQNAGMQGVQGILTGTSGVASSAFDTAKAFG